MYLLGAPAANAKLARLPELRIVTARILTKPSPVQELALSSARLFQPLDDLVFTIGGTMFIRGRV
jgi:hypothetical protein